MDHLQEIIAHCNKWHSLGVKTYLCKIEAVYGIRKFYKKSLEFHPQIINDLEKNNHGYNFLGVSLKDSGFICLDIEGTPGSLEDFNKMLEEKSLKMSDFFVEKTMNEGVHIYFRTPAIIKRRNMYAMRYGRINFDFLFNGKAFSAPSKYKDRSYSFINKSVFDLNSINDIPEMPQELSFLLDIKRDI